MGQNKWFVIWGKGRRGESYGKRGGGCPKYVTLKVMCIFGSRYDPLSGSSEAPMGLVT
jgi:hypothetical protein